MSDLEYRLEEEVARAERARLILADPLYNESFDIVHQEFLSAWQDSPSRDTEGREVLWLSLKLLKQVRAHLESVMTSGVMASETLSRRGMSAGH